MRTPASVELSELFSFSTLSPRMEATIKLPRLTMSPSTLVTLTVWSAGPFHLLLTFLVYLLVTTTTVSGEDEVAGAELVTVVDSAILGV